MTTFWRGLIELPGCHCWCCLKDQPGSLHWRHFFIIDSNKGENQLVTTLGDTDNFGVMKEWLSADGLRLNPYRTYLLNFHINNSNSSHSDSSYFYRVLSTKFLCSQIYYFLTFHHHINQLLTLSTGFFSLLAIYRTVEKHTVHYLVYFDYVHLSYGTIFWGNSPSSDKVFIMQKRIMRLNTADPFRDPCRIYLRDLNILHHSLTFSFHPSKPSAHKI